MRDKQLSKLIIQITIPIIDLFVLWNNRNFNRTLSNFNRNFNKTVHILKEEENQNFSLNFTH